MKRCIYNFLLFIAISLSVQAQWSPFGGVLYGEAVSDFTGRAVSLSEDGQILAVGIPGSDAGGPAINAGTVKVYRLSSGLWTQIGTDINGESVGDESGFSVDLSADGQVIAIGSPRSDVGTATDAGQVRVYRLVGGNWTQVGADIEGEAFEDRSGWSVSLSSDGKTVAVGEPFKDVGTAENAGRVRVYRFFSTGWTQVGGDLAASFPFYYMGASVSLSANGRNLAIGSDGADIGTDLSAGCVQVFRYVGSSWIQIGSDIEGESFAEYSGKSVDLNADGLTVAVGAFGKDVGTAVDAGVARVYRYSGGLWTKLGDDIDGEGTGNLFGWQVRLSADGNTIVAGAPRSDNGPAVDAGNVRVFEFNSTGTWNQVDNAINGFGFDDLLGVAVDISADGQVVAVGAMNKDVGLSSNAGQAIVYLRGGCEPPSFLSSSTSPASVFLNWGAVDGADLYQVRGRVIGSTNFTSIITSSTSLTIGLSPGTDYEWTVWARCVDSSGSFTITSNPFLGTFNIPVPRASNEAPSNSVAASIAVSSKNGLLQIQSDKLVQAVHLYRLDGRLMQVWNGSANTMQFQVPEIGIGILQLSLEDGSVERIKVAY